MKITTICLINIKKLFKLKYVPNKDNGLGWNIKLGGTLEGLTLIEEDPVRTLEDYQLAGDDAGAHDWMLRNTP